MAAHLRGRAAKKPAPDAGVAAVTDDDQVGTLVIGGPHDLLGGMASADVGLHGHAAPGRVHGRLLKQLGAGLLLEAALLLDLADRGAAMGEVGLDGQADQLGTVAAAFGSGLLLAAELAAWSVDLARTGSEPAHLVRRRVVTLAALVLGSAAFSVAVMVVSAAQLGDRQGFLMRAAGVAAAVAVVAILAWLSTRSNLRPARSARWLQAGSGWLGHPRGGRRGGDRS